MTSRQTLANRAQSLATLRQRVLDAGVVGVEVDYDVLVRGFRIQLDGVTHCAGRFEKVYAWLDGYLTGRR